MGNVNFSLEVTARTDLSSLPNLKDIYITFLPGSEYKDVASQAQSLVDLGYNAIPHFPARSIVDLAMLKDYVDQIKSIFNSAFERFDVIITPTLAIEAFDALGPLETVYEIDGREVDPWWGYFPFTFPINLAGLPAASVPAGFSKNKLPIGLQIIGRPRDEKTVLSISAALEKISPWANLKPTLS